MIFVLVEFGGCYGEKKATTTLKRRCVAKLRLRQCPEGEETGLGSGRLNGCEGAI